MSTRKDPRGKNKPKQPKVVREAIVDLGNLNECIDDARRAALTGEEGPDDPTDYDNAIGRIEAVRDKLPPLYRTIVFDPYRAKLRDLRRTGFTEVLLRDPKRERGAGLMLDIAHAILQNGEGFESRATDAFQEVVSDLYDGFLSAEDRAGVNPPDKGAVPPLVKWGNPDFGPYTWPVDATKAFNVEAGIVNLPPANTHLGILAWAALGHETGGHDILHADSGLVEELSMAVRRAILAKGLSGSLAQYWSERIDETASDVLGILNMGPAAGIGLVGYFRGLRAAFDGEAKLSNVGSTLDPHPADIVRGYLASSTVRRLEFSGAKEWSDVILQETEKDLGTIRLAGEEVETETASASADVVAETIVRGQWSSLEGHAFGEIQNWKDEDERIVRDLSITLTSANGLPESVESGIYAAHLVASAVTAALKSGSDLRIIFDRMIAGLKRMHDANPSWGPLFIRHPGDIARHFAFVRNI